MKLTKEQVLAKFDNNHLYEMIYFDTSFNKVTKFYSGFPDMNPKQRAKFEIKFKQMIVSKCYNKKDLYLTLIDCNRNYCHIQTDWVFFDDSINEFIHNRLGCKPEDFVLYCKAPFPFNMLEVIYRAKKPFICRLCPNQRTLEGYLVKFRRLEYEANHIPHITGRELYHFGHGHPVIQNCRQQDRNIWGFVNTPNGMMPKNMLINTLLFKQINEKFYYYEARLKEKADVVPDEPEEPEAEPEPEDEDITEELETEETAPPPAPEPVVITREVRVEVPVPAPRDIILGDLFERLESMSERHKKAIKSYIEKNLDRVLYEADIVDGGPPLRPSTAPAPGPRVRFIN